MELKPEVYRERIHTPPAISIPAVSIVLPTYNQANYLPEALDSIFQQTWHDYELIVVNDGSSDETSDILNEYRHQYDFTVIDQENQKLPGALNTGFRASQGNYLTWTSSDNIMLPNMLEEMVKALKSHPDIGLVYADWEVIDDCGKILRIVHTLDFDQNFLMRINFINACFLYRRECQEKIGLYDPYFLYVEDWEYWLRISRFFKIQRVPQVLYQYRLHTNSLTNKGVLPQPKSISIGYKRLKERFHTDPLRWYYSKLKWEWLRIKLGQDPTVYLNPR